MTSPSLRFVGLHVKTLRCYKRALLSFFNWLDDENIPLPSRAATLDDLLARYLEHLWLDDINITYAGHTLSALRRFYPRLRFKTPTARQFFANWKSVHVPRQAVPMPAEVAMALAGVAISVKDEPLALLILLGFTAFLRTGEIIRLQRNHIQVDCRSGQIILALPATKTSRNKQESVAVVDPKLAHLARRVLQAGAGTFVCHMSANLFRQKLQALLNFLKLGRHSFTGYSLRRGGASYAFACGTHFDQLLVTGRWQNIKTARQYLDSGRAALVQIQLSPQSGQLVDHFQAVVSHFCEQLCQKRTSQR